MGSRSNRPSTLRVARTRESRALVEAHGRARECAQPHHRDHELCCLPPVTPPRACSRTQYAAQNKHGRASIAPPPRLSPSPELVALRGIMVTPATPARGLSGDAFGRRHGASSEDTAGRRSSRDTSPAAPAASRPTLAAACAPVAAAAAAAATSSGGAVGPPPPSPGSSKPPLAPVSLQAAPPPAAGAAPPAPVTAAAAPPVPPPLRILVVDDSAMNAKMLSRALRAALAAGPPLSIVECEDGEAGLAALHAAQAAGAPFDVVLADGEMPVLDGYGMVAALRAAGMALPVIGVTGNALPDDVEVRTSVFRRVMISLRRHRQPASVRFFAAPC